jgi:hypothetical protein
MLGVLDKKEFMKMDKETYKIILICNIIQIVVCIEYLIRVGYNIYPSMIIPLSLFSLSLLLWKMEPKQ